MPLWTPAHLATAPLVWLDAQDAGTISHSSGSVTQWTDKAHALALSVDSGAGNPAYSATGWLGSLPGIYFDGSDRLLAALAATHNGADYTGFVVCDADAVDQGFGQITSLSDIAAAPPYGADNAMILMAYGADPRAVAFSQGGPNDTTYSFSSSGDLLMGVSRGTADQVGVRLNGAAEVTAGVGRGSGATTVMVGGDCHDDNYHFSGYIGEVIWLGYEPTATERQQIEGYLAWRWGIHAKLPGGHAHASAAPTVGGDFSLSADARAVVQAGQAAALWVTRRLAADASGFALSGRAADLCAGRLMPASAEAFVVTGQAASLIFAGPGAFSLLAEPRGFALPGQATGLLVGRGLGAAAGAVILSGQDGAMRAARLASAAGGSVGLGAPTAELHVGRPLTAANASFVLSGQGALFARTFGVAADAAGFAFTGRPGGLDYSGYQVWTPAAPSTGSWAAAPSAAGGWTTAPIAPGAWS